MFARLPLALAVAVAALASPLSASASYSVKYVDALYVPPFTGVSTCCYADRSWNEVWRPAFHTFCLWYRSTAGDGYAACDRYTNPFLDTRGAIYAKAICYDNTIYTVGPVTCVTTHP